MTSAEGLTVSDDLPLGKDSPYVTRYTPSLLRSIERADSRTPLGLDTLLPFSGEDGWTCYEFSWLNARGKPQVAVIRFQVPCASSCIIESKSLKLYLNSFAQTTFASRTELLTTLDSDLALAFRAPAIVSILDVEQTPEPVAQLPGICLDHLDIDIDCYSHDPGLLKLEESGAIAREAVHSHLFRSVCPITGQPDWASVMIEYFGPRMDHEALLRYLVSFRTHAAFHESTIEQIFMDIIRQCHPDQLTVYGRFTRRGGIDINPFRSTDETVAPAIRLPRQ